MVKLIQVWKIYQNIFMLDAFEWHCQHPEILLAGALGYT